MNAKKAKKLRKMAAMLHPAPTRYQGVKKIKKVFAREVDKETGQSKMVEHEIAKIVVQKTGAAGTYRQLKKASRREPEKVQALARQMDQAVADAKKKEKREERKAAA